MKTFDCFTTFDGRIVIRIKAKNKAEAKELVENGQWANEDIVNDDSEYYEVTRVTPVSKKDL